MKILLLHFLICAQLATQTSFAVVFGKLNSEDVSDSTSTLLGVAIMAPKNYVVQDEFNPDLFSLDIKPLAESPGLCPQTSLSLVSFETRKALPVSCTGFLVAPHLLLTAGHCVTHLPEVIQNERRPTCDDFVWVFGFYRSQEDKKTLTVARCKSIIEARNLSRPLSETQIDFKEDWALIELEVARSESPLTLVNSTAPLKLGQGLTSLGYPLGTALMQNRGQLLGQSQDFYRTNLDVFPGNSGSPVLNSQNKVIGIAVRAYPESLVWDESKQCYDINQCNSVGKFCKEKSLFNENSSHVQKINPQILRAIGH